MKDSSFVVGITGFAQSGKSFVLSVLKEEGWHTIDADAVVADLYKVGALGYQAVEERFGSEFVDGKEVNRKLLSELIVKNPEQLEVLNEIIHPLVYERVKKMLEEIRRTATGREMGTLVKAQQPVKVAIEAVYFKPGQLYDLVDKLIMVSRPGTSIPKNEPFHSYLSNFYSEKMPKPDAVLLNNADLSKLKPSVIEFFSNFPYK